MNDDRTNYQFERDECSGAVRFLGVFLIPLALIALLASAPAWGQSEDWHQQQKNSQAVEKSLYGHSCSSGPCQSIPSPKTILRATAIFIDGAIAQVRLERRLMREGFFSVHRRNNIYRNIGTTPPRNFNSGGGSSGSGVTPNNCGNCGGGGAKSSGGGSSTNDYK